MKMIFILATLIVFTSCVTDAKQTDMTHEPMERALIIGSAEFPDPVLTRVRTLEQSGVVKDVVVLESFPVQIHLQAPKKILDELKKMPRRGGLY
jgi:hypothetical protein